ncbi:MAG: aspartyl protease family protein [Rhizomicrobium sp.]
MRYRLSLCLAGLFALAVAARAEEPCRLVAKASLNMDMDQSGEVAVPVVIDGTNFEMLVDTGSYESILTEATVKALGHRIMKSNGGYLVGFGGRIIDGTAEVKNFRIGNARASNITFMVIPDGYLDPKLGGLLGADILYFFDLDFDFANAKLNLISPDHCEGKEVYWTNDAHAQIPFKLEDARHIRIKVQIDGKDVRAMVDTGASMSVMSLETAENLFGFDEATAKKDNYLYPFKTLTLQGVVVNNPRIRLVPDDKSKVMGGFAGMSREPDMILGMSVLRQLHLYIAYHEGKIYATPASAH